jgi:hypothetical protein
MPATNQDPLQRSPQEPDPLGFLAVDGFIGGLVQARALRSAFELGLVDHLLAHGGTGFEALAHTLGIDRQGLRLLIDLLRAGGVLVEDARRVRLAAEFRRVLAWRDLLETKLDFAGLAMNDFADQFTGIVRLGPGHAPKGRLLELFDYRRCLDSNGDIDSWRRTRAWMRLTSTLTRYEAGACMALHDFSGYRRMLDVGGNSGEFALQACRRHPQLQATVMDLPLVCEIGLAHVLPTPEHPRIGFVPGDARRDALPEGHDLVSFKSMLHDWPDEDAKNFMARAVNALQPGGTLLIFERGPMGMSQGVPGFGTLPVLLFFRSYRPAQFYIAHLTALGLQDVSVQQLQLDTPFFLVTGRKAS